MTITKYFLGIKNIEQQNINSVDLKSQLKIIMPKKNTFIADPFLFKYESSYYVFFELWDYNKGKIACSKLDENYNLTNIELCLDLNYHLSFPCIFTYNNHIYMIPETSSQRCIKLFECIEFPTKWKFSKNLINNISAPDVSFFQYNDIIYLFTNERDHLKIFYSNDLFGDFKAHPINNIKTNARNAGNIFIRNNILYRPAQICTPSYGYGIALYKINKISTIEYDEELIKTYNPDWFPELTGCHTFNICDNLLITDGRLRIKSPNMKQVNSINGKVYKSTDNDEFTNNYISNLLNYRNNNIFNRNTITCKNERNYLTIAQILTKNKDILSLHYPFGKLKNQQLEFFKNKNDEMNVRIQNLKDIINIFNDCKTIYWLQGKTLLGMVRDNKLIENDNDEDIGTMCKNIKQVCYEIIPQLENIGFKVIRAKKNNSIVSVMRNFRYIDICFFVNKGDKLGYEKKFFPKKYYESFTELNIDNFNYIIPLKYKAIIKYSYNLNI